ncbi:unnamed protein product, partial [Iphiclides podalirius]
MIFASVRIDRDMSHFKYLFVSVIVPNGECPLPFPSSRFLPTSSDVLDLGARLLGEAHRVDLQLQCNVHHASFYMMTEEAWCSFVVDEAAQLGVVVVGAFSISPVRWRGALCGVAACRAPTAGLRTVALRVLSSTAVVRPLHVVADAVLFHPEHVILQTPEKDYDIFSEGDPTCAHYVHLGTVFPDQPVSSNIHLVNNSSVPYPYYWSVRPWDEKFNSKEMGRSSDFPEQNICENDREATELLRVEHVCGVAEARSSVRVRVCASAAGRNPGVRRAVLMLILTKVPRECITSEYEHMIMSIEAVEERAIPGLCEAWTRSVCQVLCAQMEVWWEVVPVCFTLQPPIVHLTYSTRVKSIEVPVEVTQLQGACGVRVAWSGEEGVPRVLALLPSRTVTGTLRVPLPETCAEICNTETYQLESVGGEWGARCYVSRCGRAPLANLQPLICWLNTQPPSAHLTTNLHISNNSTDTINWHVGTTEWGTRTDDCQARDVSACACTSLAPSSGVLPQGHVQTLTYKWRAPPREGCILRLVQLQQNGQQATRRAALIGCRALEPRLLLRVLPYSDDVGTGDHEHYLRTLFIPKHVDVGPYSTVVIELSSTGAHAVSFSPSHGSAASYNSDELTAGDPRSSRGMPTACLGAPCQRSALAIVSVSLDRHGNRLVEPPRGVYECPCFVHSDTAPSKKREPLCLEFNNVPINTAVLRHLIIRNEGNLPVHWRATTSRGTSILTAVTHQGLCMPEVSESGVRVRCVPAKGRLGAGSVARIEVSVLAGTWGLYREQLLVQIENMEPVILDIWIEAVGGPLRFSLKPNGKYDDPPVLWMSTTDPERHLHVTNTSCADISVYNFVLRKNDLPQHKLPLRLYLRFYDGPKVLSYDDGYVCQAGSGLTRPHSGYASVRLAELVSRVRKYFRALNVGDGVLAVRALTESPWSISLRNDNYTECVPNCRENLQQLLLELAPRSSIELCAALRLYTSDAWPASYEEYSSRKMTTKQINFYDLDDALLLTMSLRVHLELPILRIVPAEFDFGPVALGDTRKTYFTVSHTSSLTSMELLVIYEGDDAFTVSPKSLTLAPNCSGRFYVQYAASGRVAEAWGKVRVCALGLKGSGGVTGTLGVTKVPGVEGWCAAYATLRAISTADRARSLPPHDFTDDSSLVPKAFK